MDQKTAYALALVTGGMLIALGIINSIFPNRKISLILKAASDCMSGINGYFIYLATGNKAIIISVALNVVAVTRDILFAFRGKTKVLDSIAWPIGFNITYIVASIFTYTGPICLLPLFGSLINTTSLYVYDQRLAKIGAMTGCFLYAVYFAVLIPSSDILTVFQMISSLTNTLGAGIGLINVYRKMKKQGDSKALY